jgi:chromosome partitioning protein
LLPDAAPVGHRQPHRAANRAEWFNQVNKPLEVHDILGAPQIGLLIGVGSRRRSAS